MTETENSIIALDQGTSSSRALLFDRKGRVLAQKSIEFPSLYPEDGWVEQDPETIWETSLAVVRAMVAHSQKMRCPAVGIGITNQRETTLIWDRTTGHPLYNAIVWQDRRTADFCDALSKQGHGAIITEKTGLLLDPYFSASKINWILNHIPDARKKAVKGELCFGTVDSFLLWRFSKGTRHATDATNASRTSLYNIETNAWDDALLEIFDIPRPILPEIYDSAHHFTTTQKEDIGAALPILSAIGDQQAAAIGQACVYEGSVKSTYGTGCFVIMNTGASRIVSKNRLLSTIAWQIDGEVSYALEGSIFIAGAIIQWLRDELGFIKNVAESEAIAAELHNNQGVYIVPALTGLGAPYWDTHARGAIYGLTRNTGRKQLVRAALESVAYQTHDLFQAIAADSITPKHVRIDGGMSENNWLAQFLADILNIPVERPAIRETTALGAAILARMSMGDIKTVQDGKYMWHCDRTFQPKAEPAHRALLIKGWKQAVERTLTERSTK